jgi:hypothetical protein
MSASELPRPALCGCRVTRRGQRGARAFSRAGRTGFCAVAHAAAFAIQPYEISDCKRTGEHTLTSGRRRSLAAI